MSSNDTAPLDNRSGAQGPAASRRREWRLFLFIVIFLFPLLTVALVGAYGFSIWMYQLLAGPPAG